MTKAPAKEAGARPINIGKAPALPLGMEEFEMAIYGAKNLMWAPKVEAGVLGSALPGYGDALNLGPLVSVADTITYVSGENYGDNALQEFVDEFQRLDLTVAVTEMPIEVAAEIYGATPTMQGGIAHNSEDSAPEGCLGFYTTKVVKGADGAQQKAYQGVFYPVVKAKRQGVTYTTKGSSITFANGQAAFTGKADESGIYQIFSANFDSETEAKDWLETMLKGGSDAYDMGARGHGN